MEALIRWLLRHPKKILAAFVALSVFFTLEIRNLTIDPSMEVFIPEGHSEVVFFKEMRSVFGLFSFVIVGVVDEREKGVFQHDTLELVKNLTEEFENIRDVTKVQSLYEFPYIQGDKEGMQVLPLYNEVPAGQAWIETLKTRIHQWPLLLGNLVSRDGKATGILVHYGKDSTPETRRKIYHDVMDAIHRTEAPDQDVFVAGMTAIEVNVADYIAQDMKRLMPAVFAVVTLCLWLSFRRILGVMLPMLTVMISSLWTMGMMALVKVPLNTLTSCLPVLLTAVGTAYTIHILFHFLHDARSAADREEALVLSVSRVGYAVIAAGLTTIGGFVSLGVSQVLPIHYFGLFAAFGTLVSLLSSMSLVPAILKLGLNRMGIVKEEAREAGNKGLDRLLRGYVRYVTTHRTLIYTISLLLAAFFTIGAFFIHAESDYITQFRKSSYLWKSDQTINRYFNGSSVLDIIVLGNEPDAIKEPEILEKMEALQRFVETLPHVGGTISLADYLKRMNQALHEGDPLFHQVPDTRGMVAQCLLLYSMSGDPSDLEEVINDDYSLGCISVALKTGSTRYAGELAEKIKTYNQENTGLDIHMTASMVLGKVVDDLTIQGQIESIAASTVVVFALVALILRSFAGGGLGILPLLLCIVINFGILGWSGIALQLGTAIIASVALGIGIDYAIHFLNVARVKVQEGLDLQQALEETAGTAGRAIVYNAAAVGIGFLVLVFSAFKGDIYFGAFITLTMFTASLATLTLLPCLICSFRPRFLLRKREGPR